MEHKYKLALIVGISSLSAGTVLIFIVIFLCRRIIRRRDSGEPVELSEGGNIKEEEMEMEKGDLLRFRGGEDLTANEILEAPGEVIGKSSYATLYKANLISRTVSSSSSSSVKVLRFLRPACAAEKGEEVAAIIEVLGSIRHSNLVPLQAFYAGRRGEKLLVFPFYGKGNLAHFIRDGNDNSYKWPIIYRISIGIALGLDHLHTGHQSPIVHGNLKSKNVLLDDDYQPCVSDFGLHLLLNPRARQELVKATVAQGYKYPNLNKMNDGSEKENDIYGLGVIFLELITKKESIAQNPQTNGEVIHLAKFAREALEHNNPLYHQDILLGQSNNEIAKILKFIDLGLACCSPSPSLRPHIKQVLEKLEEIDR
ncbi:putative kinase-like protein TMKL1 [Impatiens glandulifera]|uniref:putative kinase-like protein TMKL1 n=1 Tax=Impatiens glandulifera TaxID=253017 RepID=UPI001FB11BC0|nr:putative kinase-like protein TMKL1 [Impatiens glandulifera]